MNEWSEKVGNLPRQMSDLKMIGFYLNFTQN